MVKNGQKWSKISLEKSSKKNCQIVKVKGLRAQLHHPHHQNLGEKLILLLHSKKNGQDLVKKLVKIKNPFDKLYCLGLIFDNVTVVKNNFIWRGKFVKIHIPPKSRFQQEILKKSRKSWSPPILVFNCPVYQAHLRSTISEVNDACTSPEKSRMNKNFLSYFKAACLDANWPLSGHSEGNLTSLIVFNEKCLQFT